MTDKVAVSQKAPVLQSSMKKTTRFSDPNLAPESQEALLNPSPNVSPSNVQANSKRMFESKRSPKFLTMQTDATGMMSAIQDRAWKPPSNISYETMVLTDSQLNAKVRPAGFRANARYRQVKNTCMLSKIKTRCRIRKRPPKLAVCITMYNEDASELQTTLRGLLHNYNCMRLHDEHPFSKDDFLVTVICDGYDKIPDSMKKLARENKFLDEEMLF